MKVQVFLADGFEEMEAVGVIDVLRRAGITVETVSITGRREVKGAHELTVLADNLFESAPDAGVDMLVLPGGPGVQLLDAHAGLKERLVEFAGADRWIAAICAAPMVLGKLGLLKRKAAVCYPGYENYLQGAEVNRSGRTVVDGKVITSRGPGTVFHFALTIVEMLKGRDLAQELKEKMIV
ncbi:MAG TPA: DJ-1 family glyoxalase III [Patescibacteria group bacterium]|nr:DJ-1 family glyoxalase III [Patescibacteria group bacterium]